MNSNYSGVLEINQAGTEAMPVASDYLALALHNLGDGVIVTDAAGQICYVNPMATSLTGWEGMAAMGLPLVEVLHIVDDESGVRVVDLATQVMKSGVPFVYGSRFTLMAGDGTQRAIDGNTAPLRDAAGVIVGTVSVFRDISDRKQLEQALHETVQKFQVIFENASDGINIYEEDLDNGTRRLIECNERYAEMAGRSRAELLHMGNTSKLQKKVSSVTPSMDNLTLRRNRVPYRGLISWNRPDGQENIVEYAAMPVEIDGRPLTIGLDRDITEHVKLREALKQRTEDLEALAATLRQQAAELQAQNEELDAFAYTVAHDLKNPITVIVGLVDFLYQGYVASLPAEDKDYFQAIARSAQKMHTIVDELLLLAQARKRKVTCTPLDMQAIVAAALEQMSDLIGENQVTFTLPATWPEAVGYAPWVERVWVNYISNAIRYGGNPAHVTLGSTLQEDGTIRFWVQDNGAGLVAEEQALLFTPFTRLARTKSKGHGLGLSIVHRIVEKLGGTVGVESQAGRGSIFSFTLPTASHEFDA